MEAADLKLGPLTGNGGIKQIAILGSEPDPWAFLKKAAYSLFRKKVIKQYVKAPLKAVAF